MVSFSRLRGSLVVADCGLDDTSFTIDCLLTLEFSQSEQPPKPPAFIASRSLRPTRVTQRSFSAPLPADGFMLLGSGCVSLEPCPDYLVDCVVGSCARRAGLHVGERVDLTTIRQGEPLSQPKPPLIFFHAPVACSHRVDGPFNFEMRWVSSTVPHLVSLPMQFHLQFMFNLAHAVHDPLTAVAVVPSCTFPLQPQSSFTSPKRLELISLVANGLSGSSLMWRCYQLQPRVHDNDDDNNWSDDSNGQVAVSTPPPSTTAGRTRRPRHRTTLPAAPLRRSPRLLAQQNDIPRRSARIAALRRVAPRR
jgi:hypothetical protein